MLELEPFLIHAEMGMKYNKQPHDIKYERGLNKNLGVQQMKCNGLKR